MRTEYKGRTSKAENINRRKAYTKKSNEQHRFCGPNRTHVRAGHSTGHLDGHRDIVGNICGRMASIPHPRRLGLHFVSPSVKQQNGSDVALPQ